MRITHLFQTLFLAGLVLPCIPAQGQRSELLEAIDKGAAAIEDEAIAWRRDIHEFPELSNQEHRTAEVVAKHLQSLGIETQTGVAGTGVIGLIKGGKPGPVVALRADMDGLPVEEKADVPFASKVRTTYNGREVGVMHACGHDMHVAALMGAAQVLQELRDDIPGTVQLIFQPAEEGAGGANVMVDQGVLENAGTEAIFALHVTQGLARGELSVRPGGTMASSDYFRIVVKGRQTHAAMPWGGVDPIVTASQIVMGLQTVISRQTDLTRAPAVVTVATIQGGLRSNIIPGDVEMTGTIRTLDPTMQEDIHARVRRTAERIGKSAGAEIGVSIRYGAPVTYNDPALTAQMKGALERVDPDGRVVELPPVTGAEDFAFFQQKIPGVYFFMGVRPPDVPKEEAIPNHSPLFYSDEAALTTGIRALASMAVEYLESQ